ncbi:MDR family MFS transporter [Paenibacillus thalictri]|uniref:MFS-type drug efflux transporter P55 n=1 Tax=Paenibacillus thalictri TaxID=2527873 RepID=A0A4Q9DRR1_9BACL|nr:MDR family MFS transporter [Paenibacillus thalictri]TBL79497.1 MFS transporter [Paenibacillus thalictri]
MNKRDRRLIMTAMLIATFMAAIEGTIVNTATPVIVGELGGMELMSWVVSIYLLTTAIGTPISGKIADLYGRKPVFLLGTGLFLLGSILSGIAQTMEQLIAFRALQGLGAGAILPVTMTIVGDIYPVEERAKAQGWISGIWGISALISPLTGGLVVDYVSWRWIFYINVPFGAVSALLLAFVLREAPARQRKPIGYGAMAAFAAGMTCLLYALMNTDPHAGGGGNAASPVFFLAALGFLAVFFGLERKAAEPLLPASLFRLRMIGVPNASDFVYSAVLVAINFYIPLWVQGIYGGGAVASGLILIPVSIFWPIGANLAGRLQMKFGMRAASLTGLGITIAACVLMAVPDIRMFPWLLAGCLALIGLGFGVTFTVHTVSVQSAVDWNMRGSAIASNNFIRLMGQTIGVAFFGALLNAIVSRRIAAGGLSGELTAADVNLVLGPESGHAGLSAAALNGLREALASGLHVIFVAMVVLAVISFLVTLRLPKGGPGTGAAAAGGTAASADSAGR